MKEINQSNIKPSTAVLVFLFLLIVTAAEAKENSSIPSKPYPQVLTMSEHMDNDSLLSNDGVVCSKLIKVEVSQS